MPQSFPRTCSVVAPCTKSVPFDKFGKLRWVEVRQTEVGVAFHAVLAGTLMWATGSALDLAAVLKELTLSLGSSQFRDLCNRTFHGPAETNLCNCFV